MYLLDSDFIINLLKKDVVAGNILAELVEKTDTPFATSVINLAEIKEGLLSAKSEDKLQHFATLVQNMEILPISAEVALTFAEVRSFLRKKGKLIDNMDLLIAATCLKNDLTLVTFNSKHFTRIPQLKVYKTK